MNPTAESRWPALLATLLVLTSTLGCSVLKPFVGNLTPQEAAGGKEYEVANSQANILRDEVLQKRMSHHKFEFWSGATLIGAGLATAGLGLYGGTHDALLGTALGGGAIVAGRTYVPIKTRQGIYNDALLSIEKAKTETQPIKAPAQTHADQRLQSETILSEAEKVELPDILVLLHNNARKDAEELRRRVAEFNQPANRAALLLESLQNIVATANKALVEEVLDPAAALAAALKHIEDKKKELNNVKTLAVESLNRAKFGRDFYALTPAGKTLTNEKSLQRLSVVLSAMETDIQAVGLEK